MSMRSDNITKSCDMIDFDIITKEEVEVEERAKPRKEGIPAS